MRCLQQLVPMSRLAILTMICSCQGQRISLSTWSTSAAKPSLTSGSTRRSWQHTPAAATHQQVSRPCVMRGCGWCVFSSVAAGVRAQQERVLAGMLWQPCPHHTAPNRPPVCCALHSCCLLNPGMVHTRYHFKVHASALGGALARLGAALSCPLLAAESAAREVENVHAEYRCAAVCALLCWLRHTHQRSAVRRAAQQAMFAAASAHWWPCVTSASWQTAAVCTAMLTHPATHLPCLVSHMYFLLSTHPATVRLSLTSAQPQHQQRLPQASAAEAQPLRATLLRVQHRQHQNPVGGAGSRRGVSPRCAAHAVGGLLRG